MGKSLEEARTEALGFIDEDVRAGFATDEEITERIGDLFSDEGLMNAAAAAWIAAQLASARGALRAEMELWPPLTDCDRLDAVFDALEAKGLLCRQNYWCCQTCALAAIDDQSEAAIARGIPIRGYAYYHEQDTESALGGYGIALGYGAHRDDSTRSDSLAVGRLVAATLDDFGLVYKWDGNLATRIIVEMDWKRRKRWESSIEEVEIE